MKTTVLGIAAAALMLVTGCSDKTSESSFESLCVREMMNDENMKANPQGEAMAQEICSCSAPAFGKLSKQSKTEFIELAESRKDGHLTNREEEEVLAASMAGCAMQAVAKRMREANKE